MIQIPCDGCQLMLPLELLNRVVQSDCIKYMERLDDNSIDSIATDPPYGLAFMGRKWDTFTPERYQRWCTRWGGEALRVLKRGGYLIAFGGTRTYHRLVCGLEDAGFTIVDSIHWLYGCLSEDTEILVNNEWRNYNELRKGDVVLGYDIETSSLSWQPIQEIVKYDYDDTAFRIKSERTDQIVSRGHRVIVERDGQQSIVLAEELPLQQEVQVPILESVQGLSISVSNTQHLSGKKKQNMLEEMCKFDYIKEGKEQRENGQQSDCSLFDLWESNQEVFGSYQESEEQFLLIPMQRDDEGTGLEEARPQRQGGLDREIIEVISSEDEWSKESSLEGWSDLQAFQGQLHRTEICQVPTGVSVNGEEGWLRDGTQADCGSSNWSMPQTVRSSPSYRPRLKKQLDREPDAVLKQPSTQALRKTRFTSTTMAMVEPVHYKGVMWCIRVPTGAFVARRNGLIFVTGNSGFPKGQNISKMIDKKAGVEPKRVDYVAPDGKPRPLGASHWGGDGDGLSYRKPPNYVYLPVTEEAEQWHGWNTHLKPAHEPIVLVQKPLDGTVIENVLKWDVGGLNVDDCRVAVNPDVDAIGKTTTRGTRESETWRDGSGFKNEDNPNAGVLPSGRYPANLILSHHPDCVLIQEGNTKVEMKPQKRTEPRMGKYGIYGNDFTDVVHYHDYDSHSTPEIWGCVKGCPVRILNEQSGNLTKHGKTPTLQPSPRKTAKTGAHGIYGLMEPEEDQLQYYADSGGAARFFKTLDGEWMCHPDCPVRMLNEQSGNLSKSGSRPFMDSVDGTRPLGKDGIYGKGPIPLHRQRFGDAGGAARFFYCPKPSVNERTRGIEDGRVHITVKPIELIRWLIRLITPPEGIVLDPFIGSGTTGIAAEIEGHEWLGCDKSKKYVGIATKRIAAWRADNTGSD